MAGSDLINLMIVDDDQIIAESLNYVLEKQYKIKIAPSRLAVKKLLDQGYVPEIALVDLGLPPDTHKPDEGFKIITMLSGLPVKPKIVVLSGQESGNLTLQAKELGADDFIAKPCDVAEIKMRLQQQHGQAEVKVDGIIGESSVIGLMRMQIRQFSDSPFPVLIEGDSGCGKELAAKNLHEFSERHTQPYLTLNCAAFNEQLLEAQLFGYMKGAFTGATENTMGFLQEAQAGTLLLDEIGDLDLDLQAKLLRVLENREYYRLGETKPRQVHARIIAATNKQLFERVKQGQFREDLYHRLSVLTIKVPKLDERAEDKLILLRHFQDTLGAKQTHFILNEQAKKAWLAYSFPGNIRELKNIVIRLMAKFPGQSLSDVTIRDEFNESSDSSLEQNDSDSIQQHLLQDSFQLDERLKQIEKEYVNVAIDISDGNMSKAAQLLGINRSTLYGRMGKNN